MARPRSRSDDPALADEKAVRRRVAKEKNFYVSLATYAVVISGLAALNVLTSPGHWWFVYPMLGWGIGVGSHALSVFGAPGLGGWEERRVRSLMGAGPSDARLRQLLDETLDERAIPAGQPQTASQLQRRIEHLEAIVTSRDWDETSGLAEAAPAQSARVPFPDALFSDDEIDEESDESPAARAARLARRVR